MPSPNDPCLLALDSATERVAVALVHGDRQWVADEPGGARASERMLPMAFDLLAQAGIDGRAVQAVGFGRGPGAFTGLRTACAVAQGLAFGWSCPVLSLDSLALVAEDARAGGDASVWVAMDARMDEVYAAHYRPLADDWQALRPPALWTLPALQAAWDDEPPHCVAGTALAAFEGRLHAGAARRVDAGGGRADALARLARAAWARGAAIDAAQALPLYVRDKVALTTAERAARGAVR